jgi:hypothetical protein
MNNLKKVSNLINSVDSLSINLQEYNNDNSEYTSSALRRINKMMSEVRTTSIEMEYILKDAEDIKEVKPKEEIVCAVITASKEDLSAIRDEIADKLKNEKNARKFRQNFSWDCLKTQDDEVPLTEIDNVKASNSCYLNINCCTLL